MSEGFNIVKGRQSALNVTGTGLIKGGSGRVAVVIVNTAGAQGTLSDTLTTPAASNLIFNVPATAGIYVLDFPFSNGLYYTPGSGQVISISFD